jgi:hypothetical protein
MTANLSAEDRFALQELFVRYAWAIDTGDWAGYAGVFLPDALLGMNDRRYHGRGEIFEYVKGLTSDPAWPGRQHYNGNIYVEEGDGNRCKLRTYGEILYRLRDGTSHFRSIGFYRDTCVKIDGEWFFEQRLWEVCEPDEVHKYRMGSE